MSIWSKLFETRSHTPTVRGRLGLVQLDDRSVPSVTLPDGTVWVAPMPAPEQSALTAPPAAPEPSAGNDDLAAPVNNAADKSTGSETNPDPKTHPPGSTGKDRTPVKGDEEDKLATEREKAVADILQKDYQIERQPAVDQAHKDKYPGGNPKPDLKVNGDYFDIYSPKPTTKPENVADTVAGKLSKQADRLVLDLQVGFTQEQVDAILKAIQDLRDTPDSSVQTKLQELWVLMPDGTVNKVFPGVIK